MVSTTSWRHGRARAVAGVGLIEVLIAVVVLAFGLLGIAAMQATTLRNSQSAVERSTAAVQSYALLDRMRANRADAVIGAYDLTRTCAIPDAGATLAANDLNNWMSELKSPVTGLGSTACVTITRPGGIYVNQVNITIDWDDSRGTGGNTIQQFKTSTRL